MKENQSNQTVGEKSYEALWAECVKGKNTGRPDGPGWKSVGELAEKWGTNSDTASGRARRMKSIGLLEVHSGTTPTGKRANFYRPVITKK